MAPSPAAAAVGTLPYATPAEVRGVMSEDTDNVIDLPRLLAKLHQYQDRVLQQARHSGIKGSWAIGSETVRSPAAREPVPGRTTEIR